MSVEKLILGTAGLSGKPYGRNQRVVSVEDAIALIKYALDAGIHTFDTAPAYGQAENCIGHVLKCNNLAANVYTKTKGNVAEAAQSIAHLLRGKKNRANVVFLYHNWDRTVSWPASWIDGATIYFEADDGYNADAALIHFGHVQFEWNILRRTYRYFGNNVRNTVHQQIRIARSVFLQGVLAGEACPNDALKDRVVAAQQVASAFGVNLKTLALRSALENEWLDKVIIGPTTISELDECLEIARREPLGTERYVPMLDMGICKENDPRSWG